MAATPATRATPPDPAAERRFVEDFAMLLAARLQVSPAAISGAVRWLTQMHLLTRAREPGARRDHYRVVDDQWYEATVFKTAALRRYEDVLAEGVRLIGPDRPAGRRLQETRDFFAFFRAELPELLERWRASRGR